MSEEEIINGCLRHDRNAQRLLYETYGPTMLGICIRYSKNFQEAKEILLRSFRNIFRDIKKYVAEKHRRQKKGAAFPIEEWLRHNIIADALTHLHKNKKEYFVSSTVSVRDMEKNPPKNFTDEEIIAAADKKAVIRSLQQLSPSQRAIYNLSEIDGYSHKQISQLLNVSPSAIDDSLLKAKFNIRKNLVHLMQ